MKYKHTKINEAAQKVAQLQKDLDPMHDAFFGLDKLKSNALFALPQKACVKYLQVGALRQEAQRLVTTLIYRVRYLTLPRNPDKDNDEQKDTRLRNDKWRTEMGMSTKQFRKYSRYEIDVLLPLATESVKETKKRWSAYKALTKKKRR
ncbi:MAG: hypothetical protein K2X29_12365 [Candidatus Obscuribacterales bacterium]|nr:hypothetical protein [Candidatus Obscuribacterales bacterium]